jgi:hypothetical protein
VLKDATNRTLTALRPRRTFMLANPNPVYAVSNPRDGGLRRSPCPGFVLNMFLSAGVRVSPGSVPFRGRSTALRAPEPAHGKRRADAITSSPTRVVAALRRRK